MTRLVIMIVVLAGLTACAKPVHWYRPTGATRQDFARDQYECVQQSRTSWSGGGRGQLGLFMMAAAANMAEVEARRLFAMCMDARGWYATFDAQEAQQRHGSQVRAAPVAPTTPPPPTPLLAPAEPVTGSGPAVIPR